MKWVIGILDRDIANKIAYVTSVDFANKTYEVEAGKDAGSLRSRHLSQESLRESYHAVEEPL